MERYYSRNVKNKIADRIIITDTFWIKMEINLLLLDESYLKLKIIYIRN